MENASRVVFLFSKYGNFLDNYYTDNYADFVKNLLSNVDISKHSQKVNLGITDGVTIINTFKGDFTEYNLALVDRNDTGNWDLYKITSKQFIRRDLWRVTMVLDVFSKYYENVCDSKTYIERLGFKEWNEFDPILFNNEGFTVSNIKKQQIPLLFINDDIKDIITDPEAQKVKGYLLFIKSSAWDSGQTLDASVVINNETTEDYITVSSKDAFVLKNGDILYNNLNWRLGLGYYINAGNIYLDGSSYIGTCAGTWLFYKWRTGDKKAILFYQDTSGGDIEMHDVEITANPSRGDFNKYGAWKEATGNFEYDKPTVSISGVESGINSYFENTVLFGQKLYDDYSSYKNKLVYVENEKKFYRINFGTTTKRSDTEVISDTTDLSTIFQTTCYSSRDKEKNGVSVIYSVEQTVISFVEETYSVETVSVSIPRIRSTNDQGYCVMWVPNIEGLTYSFYMHYKWYWNSSSGGQQERTTISRYPINQNYINMLVNKLRENYSTAIVDVQETYFVPKDIKRYTNTSYKDCDIYLDISNVTLDYGTQSSSQFTGDAYANGIYANITLKSGDLTNGSINFIGFALDNTEGELGIDFDLPIENYKLNQLNKYILKSPSGASADEISIAKNNGLYGFRLRYSLRPYASMYQVQPFYNGYYGENFTDSRGLVMIEDTSITQVSDVYETYKRENVNYINSFMSNQAYERSRLKLEQQYQRQEYGINAGLDFTADAIGTIGGIAGNMIENGLMGASAFGQAVGNNVGGIIGGGIDTAVNWFELMRQQRYEREQLELGQRESRRQWKYTLGNMDAMPSNLDKVSGIYNTNFGYFYLEVYEPTDYELNAVEDYLELYGISIGRVISLRNYEFDYIEGKIILYEGEITTEEYDELQLEINSGRRLYSEEESDIIGE